VLLYVLFFVGSQQQLICPNRRQQYHQQGMHVPSFVKLYEVRMIMVLFSLHS
jgi:hypothetical protein